MRSSADTVLMSSIHVAGSFGMRGETRSVPFHANMPSVTVG